MNTSVAVVIPSNKYHQYLDECIDSVVNQSHPADEIILVNDGGGTGFTRQLAEKYPWLKVITLETNQGAGQARNAGVAAAQSELIAFLDSDDVWLPEKLERQLEFLEQNNHLHATHCGLTVFDQTGPKQAYVDKPPVLQKEDMLTSGHVLPSAFLIRRSVFLQAGGFSDKFRIGEDYDLILRLVRDGVRIGFQPEALTLFRRMSQGNLSSDWKSGFKEMVKLYFLHRRFFREVWGRSYFFTWFSRLTLRYAHRAGRLNHLLLKATGHFLGLFAGQAPRK